MNPTPWAKQVIHERLNLLVSHGERLLGTLNLLHEAHWYDESNIPTGEAFAALAAPAFVVA